MRLWLVIAMLICMTAHAADPIRNEATEQAKLTNTLADGGLPPVVGVQNYQVFRASRDVPVTMTSAAPAWLAAIAQHMPCCPGP